MNNRYRQSNRLIERALNSIPLGSQTFSKSITQYPRGVSPLFISKGYGSHVWDVDNNEYIDFVNGLLSVLLGYSDSEVTESVLEQLVVLDSIPLSDEAKKIGKIKQLSLASMLSEAIRRINNEESISLMFADLLYI